MVERKLATIQVIEEITPIEGAEAIEKAKVEGWAVVIKKGEFRVGDKIVYCEIDSVLPDKPEFDFLRSKKFRIRTIRLRGQLSQGIVFPLSVLPEGEYNVGDDVTETLGVVKYEPPVPACLSGLAKGSFPSFISKTDSERVQNLQKVLTRNKGTLVSISEKANGTSCTYFVKDGEFGVCSRNLELQESEGNTMWKIAKETDMESKLKSLNKNIAIQGEVVGEGINHNTLRIKGQKFMAFDLFDIDKYEYLGVREFTDTCAKLGVETVPILEELELHDDVDKWVEYAIGDSKIGGKREGVVIRAVEEKRDEDLGRLQFKSINNLYLLNGGE